MMAGLAKRIAGLAVTLLSMVPSNADAQTVPPATVSTLYVSDTMPGYGAVGRVTADAFRYAGRKDEALRQYRRTLQLDPDNAQARARLDLVGGGA